MKEVSLSALANSSMSSAISFFFFKVFMYFIESMCVPACFCVYHMHSASKEASVGRWISWSWNYRQMGEAQCECWRSNPGFRIE